MGNFYIRENEMITKKVIFVKMQDGRILPTVEGDVVEGDKVGEIVYTLAMPSWSLRNYIKSRANVTNMVGISGLNGYVMNEMIIEYLLRSWSISEPIKIVDGNDGYKIVEDVKKLLSSNIESYVFDAIVMLYNRFIA